MNGRNPIANTASPAIPLVWVGVLSLCPEVRDVA